jgi:8-oxo-dGTP pyrophosphatase MutT (NUDIX family)
MIDLDVLSANLARHVAEDVDGADIKRRAAVAAILREGSPVGPEVLLMKRVERASDPWSGQMSFPGGRFEDRDRDLLATAIRESREEVGIHLPDQAELLGRLDDLRTHTGDMLVRPYVFRLRAPVVLEPNAEVAELHWGPLRAMQAGELDTHFVWSPSEGARPSASLRFPGYDVGGRVVWGLTHRMLQLLLAHARAE